MDSPTGEMELTAGVKRFTIKRSACLHIQNVMKAKEKVVVSVLRMELALYYFFFFKSSILHAVNLNSTVSKLTEAGVDVPGSIPRQERGFFSCHYVLIETPVSLGFGAPS